QNVRRALYRRIFALKAPPRRAFLDHAYSLVAEGSPVLPHQSKSGNAGDGSQMVGQEKTPPKRGQKAKGISGIGGRGASAAGQFRARGIVPTGKGRRKGGKSKGVRGRWPSATRHRDGRIGSRKNSPAEAGPSVRVVWAQGRLRYSHPLANGQGAVAHAWLQHRRISAHDRAALRRTQEVDPRARGGDAVRHLHPARHPEERVRP